MDTPETHAEHAHLHLPAPVGLSAVALRATIGRTQGDGRAFGQRQLFCQIQRNRHIGGSGIE